MPRLTNPPLELRLARASSLESNVQYGYYVVEPTTQCPAWQSCRGGGCLAGVGFVFTMGSCSRRRMRRRVSRLAGAHYWTGLGLGYSVAWPGESCLAHSHDGSIPLDYDRADRRTIGNDALSRSDGTRLGCLLDHVFLWVLQASPSAHHPRINRCDREPTTCITIKKFPQEHIAPTTSRSDRHRHRT